jgi:hypothetical protein
MCDAKTPVEEKSEETVYTFTVKNQTNYVLAVEYDSDLIVRLPSSTFPELEDYDLLEMPNGVYWTIKYTINQKELLRRVAEGEDPESYQGVFFYFGIHELFNEGILEGVDYSESELSDILYIPLSGISLGTSVTLTTGNLYVRYR